MVNLSFRIVPGKRKSDGGYSIYLAISYNRQTRYINTGLTVTDERHFRNGKACRCRNSAEINSHLCNIMSEFRSRLLKLNLKDYANCASLKDALLQKPKSTTSAVTLHDLITLRIIRFEKEGRTNYARMHRDSLKVYANFLGNPILSKINRELVSHLALELLKHDYSNASIQIRLSHLKAALNFAILEGMVKYEVHPFAGITLPSPGRKQTDLTLDEFKKLRDYEFVSNRARFARDMFLISFYLGGINMVDLLEVDLSRDELRYSRKKTRRYSHSKNN